MDGLDGLAASQELPGSLNCQKPAPGPSSCLQLDASAAQAPSKPHMKNTVQNIYNHGLEIIFRYIIPEKKQLHISYIAIQAITSSKIQ